jgi:hypothetical protein
MNYKCQNHEGHKGTLRKILQSKQAKWLFRTMLLYHADRISLDVPPAAGT